VGGSPPKPLHTVYPRIDLPFRLVLGDAVPFLNAANELVLFAIDDGQIILCELAPLFLDLASCFQLPSIRSQFMACSSRFQKRLRAMCADNASSRTRLLPRNPLRQQPDCPHRKPRWEADH